ncbi:DUF262 domain-containing protein [Dietzia sp. CQ4]|uniref:DUF262 domain-containing protein n=1 Tax=Dietzia sp. (strain CQ4) TaxID=370437 RepID=UPI001F50A5DB|nr:DUF262 domain-containing protein [Dietzia sp. CQ4]
MVNAQERGLNQILQGPWQYQVPLYQRPYQWKESNRAQLWEDLVQLADEREVDPTASHFLGSLVLSPAPGAAAGGVQRFLVVDGQQRLTTLTLLLTAIRDHHEATGEPRKAEAVNEFYLINKFESDALRLKLLPTQADRDSYAAGSFVDSDVAPSSGTGSCRRRSSRRGLSPANRHRPSVIHGGLPRPARHLRRRTRSA